MCRRGSCTGQMRRLGRASFRDAHGAAVAGPQFPAGSAHTWDAALGITLDVGVSAWADQDGSVDLTQADTADQPAYSASNANLNNQPGVTPSTSDTYSLRAASSGSVASIKALHDGTGVTLYVAAKLDATAGDTRFLAGTAPLGFYITPGMCLEVNPTGPTLWAWCHRTDGILFNQQVAITAALHSIVLQHGSSRSPQWEIYVDGVSAASGSYGDTPNTGDSPDFMIGAFLNTDQSGHDYGLIKIWTDATIDVAEIQAAHEARFA